LTLWTVDCFRKVLGNTGTLVDVDEATLNWEQLEYARLKVCSEVASKVHVCQEMWINDSVYQVSVEEESSFVEPDSFSRCIKRTSSQTLAYLWKLRWRIAFTQVVIGGRQVQRH